LAFGLNDDGERAAPSRPRDTCRVQVAGAVVSSPRSLSDRRT